MASFRGKSDLRLSKRNRCEVKDEVREDWRERAVYIEQ